MAKLNTFIMLVADPLLGWLLHLPRDLTLFIIAIGTALILTVVRIWTTDQDLLQRCKNDKQTLKRLIKEAKQNRDKGRLAQLRTTMQQIATCTFKAEGKPLLASLLPIVLIATWCVNRIAFIPPDGTQPLQVQVYSQVLSIGRLAHAVPQEGLATATGWIQQVRADHDADGKIAAGVAEWSLTCAKRPRPYTLQVHHGDRTISIDIIVNGKTYSEPVTQYGDESSEVVSLVLPEYRPFGVVPGMLGFPAWLIGYLAIVIPLALVLKPVFKIH